MLSCGAAEDLVKSLLRVNKKKRLPLDKVPLSCIARWFFGREHRETRVSKLEGIATCESMNMH